LQGWAGEHGSQSAARGGAAGQAGSARKARAQAGVPLSSHLVVGQLRQRRHDHPAVGDVLAVVHALCCGEGSSQEGREPLERVAGKRVPEETGTASYMCTGDRSGGQGSSEPPRQEAHSLSLGWQGPKVQRQHSGSVAVHAPPPHPSPRPKCRCEEPLGSVGTCAWRSGRCGGRAPRATAGGCKRERGRRVAPANGGAGCLPVSRRQPARRATQPTQLRVVLFIVYKAFPASPAGKVHGDGLPHLGVGCRLIQVQAVRAEQGFLRGTARYSQHNSGQSLLQAPPQAPASAWRRCGHPASQGACPFRTWQQSTRDRGWLCEL
jgi:hypothetical protein